ncbi:MAG: acyl-CoA dehydrogenase [Rhodoferax sp.]|nr:acyl-CoA dehydrogenase [Rhodoferax sp.]
MNLLETPQEQAFRSQVRTWMEEHLRDEFGPLRGVGAMGSPGYDLALVKHWEQRLAAHGWIGMDWPLAHGGKELPLAMQLIFHEEYVRCGGPGRLSHIGETLLAPTLMALGTPSQQQRFLPGILAATSYWAQGYSEPGAGSDLAGIRTRAAIDERTGEWVLHGQKVWTSWARESDWIFVLARCGSPEPGQARHAGMVFLLVPLHQPGVEIRPIRQITGSAEFNEVFFDGARTAGDLHVGQPGQGWSVAMHLLMAERGASTLGQQAAFRRELDSIIALARSNGASRDPILRQRIAKAALGLQTLRSHALRVCADTALPRAASVFKYAWSNWRRDLGELAMDVLGDDGGTAHDDPLRQSLQQLWLVSRSDTIYAGSNEIQCNIIAERALGMPR